MLMNGLCEGRLTVLEPCVILQQWFKCEFRINCFQGIIRIKGGRSAKANTQWYRVCRKCQYNKQSDGDWVWLWEPWPTKVNQALWQVRNMGHLMTFYKNKERPSLWSESNSNHNWQTYSPHIWMGINNDLYRHAGESTNPFHPFQQNPVFPVWPSQQQQQ